ncbi:hypothetical protein TON_1550 [Thermococcus onnurineus NA1]|uniref:Uncharacterized protein n=1 Tax=Thermococcus onnurineus (strain NA1) TaxID=523850 RepID=B6YTU9_THEON|nr:hypothetical protein [Thermococcus onnurineus]ACJ17040.1 hypothetical protein TON_1550 [Thermococcus onnurineus NA1]
MGRNVGLLLVGMFLIVLVAGCIEGGNFVYSKGKIIGPHRELDYSFKGPATLEIGVSGNGPFTLLIISSDGSKELFKRTNVTEVKETVELPEGSWRVIIRNEGDSSISLDISLRGK